MSPARPALSVGLQLHMTGEDVDEIVAELQSSCEFGYFRKNRFTRYRITEGPVASHPDIVMLKCSMRPWERTEDGEIEMLDSNPGVLSIEVPRVRDGRIEEVIMGAKVYDEAHADRIAAWAKFLRRYRRRLNSGAFVSSVRTGARRYYKDAHATPRA